VKDADKDLILDELRDGWEGFLYTTPESLRGKELSSALKGKVKLAVIDEAHCALRERGFRYSYAKLGKTLDSIGPETRYACTATLPPHDRAELIHALNLDGPEQILSPISRSNLRFRITQRHDDTLTDILIRHDGEAGIVFAATVRTAETIHERLCSQGWPVALYHGRLKPKEKTEAQQAFMAGDLPVMIATDSFLLGIDHPHIRHITHFDYPKSPEDWMQSAGRAGRDGEPSMIYGCFRGSDEGKRSRAFLLRSSYPCVGKLRSVWDYIASRPFTDETQQVIGERALGREGRYGAGQMLTTLKRFGLVDTSIHPEDKRRRIYRAQGDFDAVDWRPYQREAADTFARFDALCEIVRNPEGDLPGAIDEYFAESIDLELSEHGDYPASWD
jgi:hypothetical protein